MTKQQFTGQKKTYTIAGELGKGGEGYVYELADDPSLVLKLYIDPLTPAKIRKLKLMVSKGNDAIKSYAAWPQDVVHDSSGKVCGFVMKKLTNYMPIHMLFSPMDRKKMFPDKGYNFLVRVAGNLARAFHACHASDLVMGDVNEGNILVNNMGMVAFIDCDSFQIRDGNEYFYCEVGVPRYTPPELLNRTSFENVVRSVNTDIFSMSILVFQLLFLGRHPFAGKNISKEEIDEEKAIRQRWFAYSLSKNHNKLSPPDNTYSIKNISAGLNNLFHRSFETDERPTAAQWIKETDAYEKQLIACSKSKVHFYPSQLSVCPWCEFKEKRNILFFLDDNYLQQINSLNNIEQFINGFRVEPLNQTVINFPNYPVRSIVPAPVDDRLLKNKGYHRLLLLGLAFATALTSFISVAFTIAGMAIIWAVYNYMPWKRQLVDEIQRRTNNYLQCKKLLESAVAEYNSPSDYQSYRNTAAQLERLIARYKDLPKELTSRRKAMEEKLYNVQLDEYLKAFDISSHSIPSIGPTRKTALLAAGVRTAADISKLNKTKVQGIGPTFIQKLFSWRRQVGSNFIYQPNNYLIGIETQSVNQEIDRLKRSLENDIKKEYQSLQYTRMKIEGRKTNVQNQMELLKDRYFQSKADMEIVSKN